MTAIGAHKSKEGTGFHASAQRRPRSLSSVFAANEPQVWLTGSALVVCLAMIVGLLSLVAWQGFASLWPLPISMFKLTDGSVIAGDISRIDPHGPAGERYLIRTGNFDLTGVDYCWIDRMQVVQQLEPKEIYLLERRSWGRFVGFPKELYVAGDRLAEDQISTRFPTEIASAQARLIERSRLLRRLGTLDRDAEEARLRERKKHLKDSTSNGEVIVAVDPKVAEETRSLRTELDKLEASDAKNYVVMETAAGKRTPIKLSEIVRAFAPNKLDIGGQGGVYLSRIGEFLFSEPREANTEGGVFPAIFGTMCMALVMSFAVAPFGVLAALYLREYAKSGPLVSAIRISVNNLAGVPSIVFGVFGLGFFCYMLGTSIDQLLFAERLPNPTMGKGGLLWAGLTLALLTLPVVIVATEEALAAVPSSMREGSYACGASKWQTIYRIVLPRALPGIMTGLILAVARGAGEVAPLMLVGVVKLAPDLPITLEFPFVHLDRSFMHLGFHIYDLGFQSRNSEAAKPMVFATTLLLITLIAMLNFFAIRIRNSLRKKYAMAKF